MGRTKRKSMRWQVEQALLDKLCIGQSRHEAKKAAKKEGKTTPDGIYSWSTYNAYKKHCIKFAEWAKSEKGCKTLEAAKQFIQEYLDMRVEQGLSAWTVHLDCSAIVKMYGASAIDLGLQVPERKRTDIKRSRYKCEHDRHVSEESNKDIIDFCKATGLRRHELVALRPENIHYVEGKVYVEVMRGKGGKHRTVEVLEEYTEYVAKYSEITADRVFEKVPQNIDVHSYRAWFACRWYEKLERPLETLSREQKYYCRNDKRGVVYDRKAMLKVSELLGHNRLNVITSNYLWQTLSSRISLHQRKALLH